MNKEQKPEALQLAEKLRDTIHLLDCGFADDIDTNDLKLAAVELESLHTRVKELETKEAKPAAPVVLPEPVAVIENGSLKWKIPTGEYSIDVELIRGLHNLYTEQQVRELLATGSQPQADALDAQRWLDYLIRNQARVCNNLDEYEGDEDCADCGYWLEFTDSNSQRWVQIGVFKNPRDAIDAAIAAAKEI